MKTLLFIFLAAAADNLYDCQQQINLQKNGSFIKPKESCLERYCLSEDMFDISKENGSSGLDPAVLDKIFHDMLSLDYCK